ncbi:MAG: prepilin-type N-terminal cleavage/methylation domain-containing protein [Tepidisphaeraceae bacterium]
MSARRARNPRPHRGFTLIEVLATLTLLGIVLPVAMRGVSLSLAAATRARHVAEASSLADTKLDELVATQAWTTSGIGGDFGEQHSGYTWTYQAVSRDYGLTEVSLRVAWVERGQPAFLDISTLTYQGGDIGATTP